MEAMVEAVLSYAEDHLYNIHRDKSSLTIMMTDRKGDKESCKNSIHPVIDGFTHLGLEGW